MVVKGMNRNTAWYSIIDSEWPAVKSHLQYKLEQGNRIHGQ